MRGGGSTTCNMPEIAAELEEAPANRAIGTTHWFETSMFWSGRSARACTACPFHGHASDLLLDLHRDRTERDPADRRDTRSGPDRVYGRPHHQAADPMRRMAAGRCPWRTPDPDHLPDRPGEGLCPVRDLGPRVCFSDVKIVDVSGRRAD
jgi:hypothetical protein